MATPIQQATPLSNRDAFRSGMRAGIPVAVGYIPIAIAFGLLAKSFDMPNVITLAMSLFIFAGASQFIGIQLIMAGSMYWEIVLTTFILNLRHFLMSASLSQRIETTSNRFLAAIAFGVTDETFSVASTRNEATRGHFVLGLNLIAFFAWNVGTWIGVFLAFGLPQSVQASMGIALYAMFIGLLVPSLTRKPVIVVAALAVVTQAVLYWGVAPFIPLSSGLSIIIATIVAAGVGALLYEQEGVT
ncbi:branched-chain amino acid ABC transporter permease [Exiguobacterium sp. SH31]|uniref:AzlC family ABC transporter permease n=1 Tax=unclassified Exiguobacterium TaxID=2644629 RepID=UPI0008D06C83|nr:MULTISPECIES: AzlC family ABC transporter permease [unclassified Exiguobacterium]OGX78994.1 branched-chain amino acid ABC transporter permease [Exiguobacterium sp. SH31]TCI68533.1 branched-chain amino acid ABC transporter permease [Exiguobacterium sp. SH0S7]